MQNIVVSNEILVERLQSGDAGMIFKAIDQNRSFLGKWLPFVSYTSEVKDTEAFIQGILKTRDENRNEVFTIWYKGDFAGLIGFHNTDRVNEKTELGYWIIEDMTEKGIVTKSGHSLIQIAFEKFGMNRITIRCAVDNVASENVARRLGFKYEGIERNGERHSDQFLDLKVFGLLKSEFDSFEQN